MSKKIFLSLSCISVLTEFEKKGFEICKKAEDADIIIAQYEDGISLCREIRADDAVKGIILVLDSEDKLHTGYESGADICVTGSACTSTLPDIAEALFRRVNMCRYEEGTVCGEYALDHKKHAVRNESSVFYLTQIEYGILEYLFLFPDIPIDRKRILSYVWGGNYYGEEKVVDVNIRRLRLKVEDNPSRPRHIVTVRGKGYMWKTD